MIAFLIKKGAEINARDSHGDTVLHSAVYGDEKEVVEFLISKGADVDAKGTVQG